MLVVMLSLAAGAALAQSSATVTAIDDSPQGESAYHYDPATLTVAPGATITFVGGKTEPHTLTHDAAQGARLFDSGETDPGKSSAITAPTTPGSYPFHCLYHGGMRGTLTVAAASTSSPPVARSTSSSPPARATPALPLALALATLGLLASFKRRRA